MKKLLVTIGSDRFTTSVAHVNDSSKPTCIDTPLFVGRILVKIKDFSGIAPEGCTPIKDHPYFEGRSRKFDIQIEGRFKSERPYSGDEIHFGSDFDKLIDFPKAPFNAGLKVAQWIDPNTSAEFTPASGRPYIMSPYLACMNTFSAFPSPAKMGSALVYLKHSELNEDYDTDDEDLVPTEVLKDKKKWRTKPYWRFIGLKDGEDNRIVPFIEKHKEFLMDQPEKRPMPRHQTSFGTSLREKAGLSGLAQKLKLDDSDSSEPSRSTTPTMDMKNIPTLSGLAKGDLAFASQIHTPPHTPSATQTDLEASVERQLGPWRFSNPNTDPVEDNSFVFLNKSVSIAKRRKYFSEGHGKNRKAFVYDPQVVYAASFFAPFMNFNTFDLSLGPVKMNVSQYFTEMPVRYTLRSTRLTDHKEEEVFVTISFQLVEAAE